MRISPWRSSPPTTRRAGRVRERAFLAHLAAEAKANRKERKETLAVLRGLTKSAVELRADVRTSLHLETRAAAGVGGSP